MATTAETLRRTNELPGTRAKLSGLQTSAFKVREVLDLIRGKDVIRANEILQFCDRGPAVPVQKLLNSAIANAVQNDELIREELFVAACFADEGTTMKRIKPGARGRAGRIRKRSSQITIIVSRLPEDRLERLRAEQEKAAPAAGRRRRVAGSRAARTAASKKADAKKSDETAEPTEEELTTTPEVEAEVPTTEEATTETPETEAPAESEAAEQSAKEEK